MDCNVQFDEDDDSLTYLTSNTMATISSTLALAANVTGFDCTELWTQDSNGTYYCPYVYATPELQLRCPHLLTGHHPRDKIEHLLSPKLCELAKSSPKRYHWRVFPTTERPSDAYKGVTFPVLTEVAYFLESTNEVNIFIVGLATELLPFKPSTFKFLQGLGYAIYVAAFLMKDNEGIYHTNDSSNVELDQKKFDPKKSTIVTPYISAVNLAAMAGGGTVDVATIKKNLSEANLNRRRSSSDVGTVKVRGSSFVSLVEHDDENVGMMLSDSPPTVPDLPTDLSPMATMSFPRIIEELKGSSRDSADSGDSGDFEEAEQQDSFNEQAITSRFEVQTRNRAPTWDPTYPFSYPVGEIPSDESIPDDLNDTYFSKMTHLADGSNSNIYTAMFRGEKVIVKMIKKGMETDAIALHEFDLEYGMLSRIRHPHVIRLLGAGYQPRRFMVLEYLSGGSLSSLLEQNEAKKGFANMMFRKPTFTYAKLLQKATDMAEALDFLHFHCHQGATIIHRDLKPDNVGFAADGTLKLFDFGLVTCVRTRSHSSEAYNMTGHTGSLRYMAPEVALREPYSEKVDVYSFGIMLWQMARDSVPFSGLGKTAFMQEVVRGNLRPKLDRAWPEGFNRLLTNCWGREPEKRPSFATILVELKKLMNASSTSGSPTPTTTARNMLIRGIGLADLEKANSSWF